MELTKTIWYSFVSNFTKKFLGLSTPFSDKEYYFNFGNNKKYILQ